LIKEAIFCWKLIYIFYLDVLGHFYTQNLKGGF